MDKIKNAFLRQVPGIAESTTLSKKNRQENFLAKRINSKQFRTYCPICEAFPHSLFSLDVLQKYNVQYFQCANCFFVFTEYPYWLSHAYTSAISSLDVGLVQRNLQLAEITAFWLGREFPGPGRFLDYAGGYGLFTRLLRDKGFDFYRQDKFCENIFAVNYDLQDLPPGEKKFDVVTAFEVFEHFTDPRKEIGYLFEFSDTIFFSTTLAPAAENLNGWWYLSPESGQHISFFRMQTLQVLANLFAAKYYTNGNDIHILTRNPRLTDPFPRIFQRFSPGIPQRVINRIRRLLDIRKPTRPSLIPLDHESALNKLRTQKGAGFRK